MTARVLRIGVAGLGRAFTLMLPTLSRDPRVRLVAAADPVAAARQQFERDLGGRSYEDVAALCADPEVDVVYIATPHGLHAEHALFAFAHGKHVLVEKPLAVTLDDCSRMVDAAAAAGCHIIVGHSHSFDGPVLRTRALLDSGEFGAVRMIHAFYATDYLYRPRRPEELRTADGGGVIYSQAVHQLDIVRLLGGGLVRSVRAQTGAWDPQRPTEGAYSAVLTFANGAFASATYSGYAHYDGDELADNFSEMGLRKSEVEYGAARRRLANATPGAGEATLKAARNYGGSAYAPAADGVAPVHQHFGHVLVCCDRGDLRPTPRGVAVYGDNERRFEPLPPPVVPRVEVVDELWSAVVTGRPPLHDGRWARATLEVCAAMLDSARDGRDVALQYQTAPGRSQ